MATRAIIKLENSNLALYKHNDGYPAGTFEWLKEFNKEYEKKNKFSDSAGKFAQLVRSSVKLSDKYGLDNSDTMGWAVLYLEDDYTTGDAGEQYVYILHEKGDITIHTVSMND